MKPQNDKSISNHELVALAVFLLGGATRPIDTEDIAKKADELAPGRFSWRKYKDQINLELIRVFLSDAKKEKNGALVDGSGSLGWQLTQNGLTKSKQLRSHVKNVNLVRETVSPAEKKWRSTEKTRLLSSDAFQIFSKTGISSVPLHAIEAFFRLNDYILGAARERKVNRVHNAFSDDAVLGEAVKNFAEIALKENKQ